MLTPVPPTDCMSAREAASARLDGEASELDLVRLDAHLLECPDCRAFASAIAAVACEIQAAPLERPSRVETLPSRRRSPVVAVAAVAALVAAVTVSSFAVGRVLGSHATPSRASFAGTKDASAARQDSTEQHLLAMLNSFDLPQPAHLGRMHAV
jgi:predicted anti-sigma-YlaC factor YlaD